MSVEQMHLCAVFRSGLARVVLSRSFSQPLLHPKKSRMRNSCVMHTQDGLCDPPLEPKQAIQAAQAAELYGQMDVKEWRKLGATRIMRTKDIHLHCIELPTSLLYLMEASSIHNASPLLLRRRQWKHRRSWPILPSQHRVHWLTWWTVCIQDTLLDSH